MADDRYYNPYWGYQNGHKRNSRVVNDFAPSAILTWDWDINNDMKTDRTDVDVESAALHTDELGNDIHRGTRIELDRHGIPHAPRAAWLLSAAKAAEEERLHRAARPNGPTCPRRSISCGN